MQAIKGCKSVHHYNSLLTRDVCLVMYAQGCKLKKIIVNYSRNSFNAELLPAEHQETPGEFFFAGFSQQNIKWLSTRVQADEARSVWGCVKFKQKVAVHVYSFLQNQQSSDKFVTPSGGSIGEVGYFLIKCQHTHIYIYRTINGGSS